MSIQLHNKNYKYKIKVNLHLNKYIYSHTIILQTHLAAHTILWISSEESTFYYISKMEVCKIL